MDDCHASSCGAAGAGWGATCVAVLGGLWSPCLPAQALPAPASELLLLPDVVVTARRIEENSQLVPVSVQVLSGEFFDTTKLTRMYDLQFSVPGLVVDSIGLFGANFSLRGVANQGGTGQSVASHLNGVYLDDPNLALARLFDVERIEVLKGPQGTLYGRNTTGGSINILTRLPEGQSGAGIELSRRSFSTTRAQGHANVPFSGAAVRLAFIASEGDGYIRNSVDERRFAEEDFWGLRATVQAEAGDRLGLTFMAQHLRDQGASGELWTPHPDFLADPRDIRLATVTLADPYLETETDNVNLVVEHELGFAVLQSTTGYARVEVNNLDDCAGVPPLRGCARGVRPAKHDQWSQEIQLHALNASGVEWLVGANYFDADSSMRFFTDVPLTSPIPINNSHSTSSETSAAIFGQAIVPISEVWRITGGARLQRDETRVTTFGTGIRDSPALVTGKTSSNQSSWRLDLVRAAHDGPMVYASVATGFKSGGVTTEFRNDVLDSFDPENLTAYEVGAKSDWLDRRLMLNAAAFYYGFDDMQVDTTTLIDGIPVSEVDNAAQAELYGLDAEFVFMTIEGLRLSAGAVWLPKREFVEYRNDVTGDTLSGNHLVRAPEWMTSTTVTYEHPLGARGSLSTRLEYNYRSKHYFTVDNDPMFAQDGFGLFNVYLTFRSANDKWYAFASGRNLTNEDYFHQVFLQSSPGYPDTYEVGLGYRF